MTELVAGIVISALAGGLLTGFGFMVAFAARFARMESKLDNVCERLDSHHHSDITTEQGRQDERIKNLERRAE